MDIRQSYTDSFSKSTVETERGRQTEVETYRQKEAQSRCKVLSENINIRAFLGL